MEIIRYNHLNSYLKSIFGERTLKICIDGGFTCPNRDGRVGLGGCIFCGSMGAGELIKYRQKDLMCSIVSQVNGFISSYRGERANKFIVYFQSFSNTYDTIENLKIRYDTALSCSDKIVGLAVATRPDCVDEDVARLLSSYASKYYVCVELGLQTANEDIGKTINRGYNNASFIRATSILNKYNIPVVAHLMVGLSNEEEQDILNTVKLINNCRCEGIKIHSTYVIRGTRLEEMYLKKEYTPIAQEYYVEMVGKIIAHLRPDIIIHRLNADPPKEMLLAPEWVTHKKLVINDINRHLAQNNITQGCSFKE